MSEERHKLEQQLKAKAEAAIRKLLTDLPDQSKLTMSDMEDLIGKMGHEMMRDAMQAVAETEQIEGELVVCETCGCRMHKRGKRKKQIITRRGEIELERQYYVCPQCGEGIFPPR
jgi:hypothetical protein